MEKYKRQKFAYLSLLMLYLLSLYFTSKWRSPRRNICLRKKTVLHINCRGRSSEKTMVLFLSPTSTLHEHQIFCVTSSLTRLNMKTQCFSWLNYATYQFLYQSDNVKKFWLFFLHPPPPPLHSNMIFML